jgi:hypothetical protein
MQWECRTLSRAREALNTQRFTSYSSKENVLEIISQGQGGFNLLAESK